MRIFYILAGFIDVCWTQLDNFKHFFWNKSLADRTVEDLTQYPVFPWVLTDYTSNKIDINDESIYRDLSKPMGALNPERLERLKERCEEMGNPKYVMLNISLSWSAFTFSYIFCFYLDSYMDHIIQLLASSYFTW